MFNPVEFIKETRSELERVTWPTRKETIRLTQVVIIVSLIVSFYMGFLDFIFNEIFKAII